MRTAIALLACLIFAGAEAWASESTSKGITEPVVIKCFCLTDLERAVKSQSVPAAVTAEATERGPLSPRYRLYRDGYRPVIYGTHHYWCRIEGAPLTGSRVNGNVFCQEAQDIENAYELGNHL